MILRILFNRHDPLGSESFDGYVLMIAGERGRRGGERQVIAEDAQGERGVLATWIDGAGTDEMGRWRLEGSGELYEDVRAKLEAE